MHDVLRRRNEKLRNADLSGRTGTQQARQNQSKIHARKDDSRMMLDPGATTIFAELESFIPLSLYDTQATELRATSKSLVQTSLLRTSEYCFWSSGRYADEYVQ